jgi:hypothetical protein
MMNDCLGVTLVDGVLIVQLSIPGRYTIFRHPLLGSTRRYKFQRVFTFIYLFIYFRMLHYIV